MSKKWSKFLLALAGIGAAIGIGIAFFKKKQHTLDDNSEFSDDFEDEDFDLDSDLEPVTQRSYVSLNQEITRFDTCTYTYNTVFIQIFSSFFTHVRNIRS